MDGVFAAAEGAGLPGVLGAAGAGSLAGVLTVAAGVDSLVGVFAAAPVAMARVWDRAVCLGWFAVWLGIGEIGNGRGQEEKGKGDR